MTEQENTGKVLMGVEALKWLSEQGCTFAYAFGRTKNSRPKGWNKNPLSLQQAIEHDRQGNNISFLSGDLSGNIIALDLDKNYPHDVETLGDYAQTSSIVRTNRQERGKLLYRVSGELPHNAQYKANPEDESPYAEILSTGKGVTCPPSRFQGEEDSEEGEYILTNAQWGIKTLKDEELNIVWKLITGKLDLYKKFEPKTVEARDTGYDDSFKERVRAAWTTLAIFSRFGWDSNGTKKEGDETRISGNGGLHVGKNGVWCHRSNNDIGGDEFDAWAYSRFGRVIKGDKLLFRDVLDEMADAAGIPKPANPTRAVTDENYLLTEGIHDEGNAQCFLRRHKGEFCQNDAWGWMNYNGMNWDGKGAKSALERAVTETLIARANAALTSGEAHKYKELINKCVPSADRVQSTIRQYSSLVYVDENRFDRDPDVLNCWNGAIDLRTGELLPHSADQYLTCTVKSEYRPNADWSRWRNWLLDTVGGNESTVEWLQMAVGYTLTGHTREEVLFYLLGPTRSGKGTFTEALHNLLDDPLARAMEFATLTSKRDGDNQNFDLAPLKPCRLVIASESNAYERFNEGKLKHITGGDIIQCAFKRKDLFNYRPQFKIWLASNNPVNADPDDEAVWARIRLIEFPNSKVGHEDKSLKNMMKAREMKEAILAWAVAGAKRWYQLGTAGLPELARSSVLKEEQRAALDSVRGWLEERCVRHPGSFVPNRLIYPSYERWCEDSGHTPKLQKSLTQSLKLQGFEPDSQKINGVTYRGICGLRLLGAERALLDLGAKPQTNGKVEHPVTGDD